MKLKEALNNLKGLKKIHTLARYQYVIEFENGEVFQSYNSIVGIKMNNIIILSRWHNYSNTTSRYRSIWLKSNSREIEKKIKIGEIILDNEYIE